MKNIAKPYYQNLMPTIAQNYSTNIVNQSLMTKNVKYCYNTWGNYWSKELSIIQRRDRGRKMM